MKSNWLATVAAAVFVAIVFAVAWAPPAGHAAPPAQIDAAALFQQRCASCHGPNGQGTQIGPALTQLGEHTDEQLFQSISDGKSGTAMPAWKAILSAEEIRELVPYLRSLDAGAMNHSQPPPSPVVMPNPVVEPALAIALDLTPGTAGRVVVRATVRDPKGQAVSNVPVSFRLHTALGGRLEIGSAKTDALGAALIEYGAGEGRNITLEAYAALPGAQPVATSATAATPGGEQAWTPGPLMSPSPPTPLVAVLALVLGGVWLTYAFVGRHLLSILRGV